MSRQHKEAPTGDAFTDAVLQICYNSLFVLEEKNAFENYIHFFRYFCHALDYLRYDTKFNRAGEKVKKLRDYSVAEVRMWGMRLVELNWLKGADRHQIAGRPTDEQLARIVYTRYVKTRTAPCGNELYVLMREFQPTKPGLRPFCRANAEDYNRTCSNISRWPQVAFAGAGGDGGGGLGRGDDAKWEEQLAKLDRLSDALAGIELQRLLDTLKVPTGVRAGVAAPVAVAVARYGGRPHPHPRRGRGRTRSLVSNPFVRL